jgi:hypothetical protein
MKFKEQEDKHVPKLTLKRRIGYDDVEDEAEQRVEKHDKMQVDSRTITEPAEA